MKIHWKNVLNWSLAIVFIYCIAKWERPTIFSERFPSIHFFYENSPWSSEMATRSWVSMFITMFAINCWWISASLIGFFLLHFFEIWSIPWLSFIFCMHFFVILGFMARIFDISDRYGLFNSDALILFTTAEESNEESDSEEE